MKDFNYLIVEVRDVTGHRTEVVDQFDRDHVINTRLRRAGGVKPRVGETWLVDRTIGDRWNYSTRVDPEETPIIRNDLTYQKLLEGLHDTGYIVNKHTLPRVTGKVDIIDPDPDGTLILPNPALKSLIQALDKLGLIDDQTT